MSNAKTKLTAMQVAKLQPRAAAYLVWDATQPGLAVRVQPSGRRTFVCVYNRMNRTRWFTIGPVALEQAREIARDIVYRVAKGEDPAAEKKAKLSGGTFQELSEAYVEQHAKKTNKSWRQADGLIRHHVLPKWGKLLAADISRAEVKRLVAGIATPVAANQVLKSASALFSWALREEFGGVTVNPCNLVERHKTKPRERVLSDSEIPLLWAAFDDAGERGAALKTIFLTGQRPGEVAAMRREHVRDGWWEMPGAPDEKLHWPGTKNSESHRVFLSKPVLAVLAALGDRTSGPMFRHPWQLDAAMRAMSKKLGVPPVRPHDLRRTFLTKVTGLGYGRDAMDRLANHVGRGVTDVYDQHEYGPQNQKIWEAVGAHVLGLAEGRVAASNVVAFGVA